jgi:hypothetical protein
MVSGLSDSLFSGQVTGKAKFFKKTVNPTSDATPEAGVTPQARFST